MTRIVHCAVIGVLLSACVFAAPASADSEGVWSLEKAYWDYVKSNDLEKYRSLWHEDFLGWPSVSPEPLRKNHITDWITFRTSKGEMLESYDLERLTVQVTGDVATVTYRVGYTFADKNGTGQPSQVRIIHTWLRSRDGKWQIVSGMSAPTNGEGR